MIALMIVSSAILSQAGPDGQAKASPVVIAIDRNSPAVAWATGDLIAALKEKGSDATIESGTAGAFAATLGDGKPEARTPSQTAASKPAAPESYVLSPTTAGVDGSYADDTGGMYALLDLAERVRMKGLDALRLPDKEEHRPTVEFRGVNPFLTIPLADKDGQRDWEHWWFTDEEFWKGYLDLLAKARINWIDLHGMYDMQTTLFPNIWPYFVVSEKYPDVGVPPEQARKNLAMLAKVCRMARQRGVRIAVMNYTGGWNWPGCRQVPDRPAEDFIAYTKEGLKQIVQGCPDLAMIGFRIGESGYGEDFYAKSYVAALEELGRPLPLYTRTWGAEKKKLLELGGLYPDKFYIEIKYNGEQMGPPWHVAGGRMATWHDYSYQDYLFYPRAYKVIWQIRANGTHRVFQWAGYEHIRECVRTADLAGSVGFCVEPMSTYYPMTDFLHKKPLYRWEYERNELWYLMWGRLAYDPNTPEDVFRAAARRHWGPEYGDPAYDLLQSMSRIVPTVKTQFSLGPDHRNHAPELEWGGSIAQWARSQPFDTYFAMGPADYARERVSGEVTGRRTPLQTAALLDRYAADINRQVAVLPYGNAPVLDDLILDGRMIEALARYYSVRLAAACTYALAEYSGTADARSTTDLTALVDTSQVRWKALAELGDANYRPFLDTLRMHTQTYLWSQATANFARDSTDLRTMLVSDVAADTPRPPPAESGGSKLRVWPDEIDRHQDKQTLTVHASVAGLGTDEKVRKVNLLWKPFRSESAWRRMPMEAAGTDWAARVEITAEGAMYGLEVITTQNATMARVDGERPYGVIDPWPVR